MSIPLKRLILAATLAAGLAAPALAVNPDEILPDPAQEHRAREVGKELRCLVCQNQSIDESDADLARDLRLLVRERIKAGDSDPQIKQYLVDRYGDYVLLKPPFKLSTYALWFSPLLFLALAGLGGFAFYRGRRSTPDAAAQPLTEAERRRLDALLGDDKPS